MYRHLHVRDLFRLNHEINTDKVVLAGEGEVAAFTSPSDIGQNCREDKSIDESD